MDNFKILWTTLDELWKTPGDAVDNPGKTVNNYVKTRTKNRGSDVKSDPEKRRTGRSFQGMVIRVVS